VLVIVIRAPAGPEPNRRIAPAAYPKTRSAYSPQRRPASRPGPAAPGL